MSSLSGPLRETSSRPTTGKGGEAAPPAAPQVAPAYVVRGSGTSAVAKTGQLSLPPASPTPVQMSRLSRFMRACLGAFDAISRAILPKNPKVSAVVETLIEVGMVASGTALCYSGSAGGYAVNFIKVAPGTALVVLGVALLLDAVIPQRSSNKSMKPNSTPTPGPTPGAGTTTRGAGLPLPIPRL